VRLDRTLGPQVVSWIETNLCHGPGDVQGQPVELDDEQVGFVCRAYELDNDGRRVVLRAVFSRAKGRGKSELAAMLVCAEALGPTRFRGWGHDGRPLGHPVTAPYIPCVATEEGQAGHVYQAAAFMLTEGAVSATPGLDVGQTRTFTPRGGVIRPVTARATSKEGGRESFAVFDETSLDAGRERFRETLRRPSTETRCPYSRRGTSSLPSSFTIRQSSLVVAASSSRWQGGIRVGCCIFGRACSATARGVDIPASR
jgi:hypothetical protein